MEVNPVELFQYKLKSITATFNNEIQGHGDGPGHYDTEGAASAYIIMILIVIERVL